MILPERIMKVILIRLLIILVVITSITACNTTQSTIQTRNTDRTLQAPTEVLETKEYRDDQKDSLVVKNSATHQPISEKQMTTSLKDSLEPEIHKIWNYLLKKHVSEDGFVSYSGFKNDADKLKTYFSLLSGNVPDINTSRDEKLAYWINAYNAFTVQLILDHYPVKSIKDIKNPWDIRFFKLGEKWYNLNEIEHKILRKMNEPRIHFAIVCASISCPKLQDEAFNAKSLETQLEAVTTTFLTDPSKNIIDTEKMKLSLIFRWFSKDFKRNGSVLDFIKPYVNDPINDNAKISYQKYDWGLNGN